jgi:hypothetical protein
MQLEIRQSPDPLLLRIDSSCGGSLRSAQQGSRRILGWCKDTVRSGHSLPPISPNRCQVPDPFSEKSDKDLNIIYASPGSMNEFATSGRFHHCRSATNTHVATGARLRKLASWAVLWDTYPRSHSHASPSSASVVMLDRYVRPP